MFCLSFHSPFYNVKCFIHRGREEQLRRNEEKTKEQRTQLNKDEDQLKRREIQILFGFIALCGVMMLPWITRMLTFSSMDDIIEVVENYIRPKDRRFEFHVDGFRFIRGVRINLGITKIEVGMNRDLCGEGIDNNGKYIIEGKIINGSKFNFIKKYSNGIQFKFNGDRKGIKVSGSYESNKDNGSFEMRFKAKLWVGQINKNEAREKLNWILNNDENTIYGLGQMRLFYLLKQSVESTPRGAFVVP